MANHDSYSAESEQRRSWVCSNSWCKIKNDRFRRWVFWERGLCMCNCNFSKRAWAVTEWDRVCFTQDQWAGGSADQWSSNGRLENFWKSVAYEKSELLYHRGFTSLQCVGQWFRMGEADCCQKWKRARCWRKDDGSSGGWVWRCRFGSLLGDGEIGGNGRWFGVHGCSNCLKWASFVYWLCIFIYAKLLIMLYFTCFWALP